MSPEAQRIAIAEACGWQFHAICKSYNRTPATVARNLKLLGTVEGGPWDQAIVPDYLNNLNAMHEAEKMLDPLLPEQSDERSKLFESYELEIEHLCDCSDPAISPIHATAAQRAEAFLRTTGKWVEE